MKRVEWRAVLLLFLAFLLAGCGAAASEGGTATPSLALASPLSTATPLPTNPPTPTPTATPAPTPAPIQLVVLHTNDNWGETEPCG